MQKQSYITDRLENCTFVKTVLMLLVVLYHSVLFWGTENWLSSTEAIYQAPILAFLSGWLNSFHIYGFVLVSGYLFYYLKCEKNKYTSFALFVQNKAKRLIIPCIFVSVIWAIPIGVCVNNYGVTEVVNRFILGVNPNQLWFLLMLFWVFILFWPFTNVFNNRPVLGAMIALSFWGIGVLGGHYIPNYYGIWYGFQFFIYFSIGFYIRKYEKRIKHVNGLVYAIVGILLYILYVLLDFKGILAILCSLLIHISGAITAFEFFQWLSIKVTWKKSRVFLLLSKRSMVIYLFHQQVIYLVILWLNGKVNPYINATTNFVVSMTVAVLISVPFMKYKIIRFFIGEK